jgi:hypothetical protein
LPVQVSGPFLQSRHVSGGGLQLRRQLPLDLLNHNTTTCAKEDLLQLVDDPRQDSVGVDGVAPARGVVAAVPAITGVGGAHVLLVPICGSMDAAPRRKSSIGVRSPRLFVKSSPSAKTSKGFFFAAA